MGGVGRVKGKGGGGEGVLGRLFGCEEVVCGIEGR